MNFKELLQSISPVKISGKTDIPVDSVTSDSRKIEARAVFVAVKGVNTDGHDYIKEAVASGVSAIVASNDFFNSDTGWDIISSGKGITFVAVDDTYDAFVSMANAFYGNPSSEMPVIGVTGTNGKTSVTYILEHIFKTCGMTPAVIGTVTHRVGAYSEPSNNTTPSMFSINNILSKALDCEEPVGVLEVSSHAIKQQRVKGVLFDVKVLTNVTSDHLDYHDSLEDYQNTKLAFFADNSDAVSVLNADEPLFDRFRRISTGKIVTYGIDKDAHFQAVNPVYSLDGMTFDLLFTGIRYSVRCGLIGRHNLYNILAAVAAASMVGVDPEDAVSALSDFQGVPGRLECVYASEKGNIFVDYAHTPDGLEKVLSVVKGFVAGRLLVVFGCGGDRDTTKRPVMGAIAEKYADKIYLTNDNPRSESPEKIADEILAGITDSSQVVVKLDRYAAIKEAVDELNFDDCVIIAGKGHEDYQIIGEERLDFSDADVVRSILGQGKKKGVVQR